MLRPRHSYPSELRRAALEHIGLSAEAAAAQVHREDSTNGQAGARIDAPKVFTVVARLMNGELNSRSVIGKRRARARIEQARQAGGDVTVFDETGAEVAL